jgi:hypothetical protein
MREIKSPNREKVDYNTIAVFLAGSIEMGQADNWQPRVIAALEEYSDNDVVVYNPRRDDWDSSWEQSIHNEKFYEQVTWELDRLRDSSIIFMYFDPNTKSPISLLELGLHATDRDNKLIVCCPPGFWRKGNVDIVCQRFGIPVFNELNVALVYLKSCLYERL